MISTLGKHAVVAATVAALGGLTAIAAQQPAHAGGFSTAYTCTVPVLGSRIVGLDGWLSSPGQTAAGGPAGFRLHISRLNLGSPVAIGSWNASAWIDVNGAENASFRVTGSGGFVPAQHAISGDLTGEWAPSMPGTDLLSVNSITITANTAVAGDVTVQCLPRAPRPVAETLTVVPTYQPGVTSPVVVVPHPGWSRPIGPPYHHHHHGWPRPIVQPHHHHHHPGWSRPVVRPHQHQHVPVRPVVVPRHTHGVPVSPVVVPRHTHGGR